METTQYAHMHQRQVKSQWSEILRLWLNLVWYSQPSEITGPTVAAAPEAHCLLANPSILGLLAGIHLQMDNYLSPKRAAWVTRVSNRSSGLNPPDSSPGPIEGTIQRHLAEECSIGFCAKKSRLQWAEHPSALTTAFQVPSSIISWLTTHPAYSGWSEASLRCI